MNEVALGGKSRTKSVCFSFSPKTKANQVLIYICPLSRSSPSTRIPKAPAVSGLDAALSLRLANIPPNEHVWEGAVMVCPTSLADEMQRVIPAPAAPATLVRDQEKLGGKSTKTDNKENISETYPLGIF